MKVKGVKYMAFDYKKEYKEFYAPPKVPTIIDIPPMNYLVVKGNSWVEYQ